MVWRTIVLEMVLLAFIVTLDMISIFLLSSQDLFLGGRGDSTISYSLLYTLNHGYIVSKLLVKLYIICSQYRDLSVFANKMIIFFSKVRDILVQPDSSIV